MLFPEGSLPISPLNPCFEMQRHSCKWSHQSWSKPVKRESFCWTYSEATKINNTSDSAFRYMLISVVYLRFWLSGRDFCHGCASHAVNSGVLKWIVFVRQLCQPNLCSPKSVLSPHCRSSNSNLVGEGISSASIYS